MWTLSHRCDKAARVLADRHYNRQSVGAAMLAAGRLDRGGEK